MSTYVILLMLLVMAAIVIYTFNRKNSKKTNSINSKPAPPLPTAPSPEKKDSNDTINVDKPSKVKSKPADLTAPTSGTPISTEILKYADRKGYDSKFVKTRSFKIDLNEILKNIKPKLTPLKFPQPGNQYFLHYHHFSIVMNKERNMPLLAAVNIDGSKTVQNSRGNDKWIYDPRLDKSQQLSKEYYKNNNLDLGHLVRRLDPVWGDVAIAADADTFHLTVSAPQHKNLNRITWLSLEDYILKNTDIEDLKVSVYTGPVFTDHDFAYKNALVPLQFWKMAALIKKNGTPSVTAYLLSHEEYLDDMGERGLIGEEGFGAYKTYQISLEKLEELTQLHLEHLKKYDPLAKTRSLGITSFTEIEGAFSIQL